MKTLPLPFSCLQSFTETFPLTGSILLLSKVSCQLVTCLPSFTLWYNVNQLERVWGHAVLTEGDFPQSIVSTSVECGNYFPLVVVSEFKTNVISWTALVTLSLPDRWPLGKEPKAAVRNHLPFLITRSEVSFLFLLLFGPAGVSLLQTCPS